MAKSVSNTAILLPVLLLLAGCSKPVYTLRSAYEELLNNDANAHRFFTYDSEPETVHFSSNPSGEENPKNEQQFTNAKVFMVMIGFSLEAVSPLFEDLTSPSEAAIQAKYSCTWSCLGNYHVMATFSEFSK